MEGNWISPGLKIIPVIDHLMEVQARPKKFGIVPASLEKAMLEGATRDEILIQVMQRGWVRHRSHGTHSSFEGYGRNDDIIAAALVWAKKTKAWANESVLINNLKNKTQWVGTIELLKKDFFSNPRCMRFTKIKYRDLMITPKKIMRIKKHN